ncbi:MAG: N-acetyl-alpha-D-glucosaminyl L-malate synthase BshA [Candidatus Omnitrophota bacterium]|jgi:N-acetyl-alpha-D-glucosaminyl L-malate synthase BshA|nr:MAG: N-acetyl-alpha-D-glucosaminyl L-malate synthase BshA [Candidatus Omnitrophota bacterium]
MKIGIVCYPSIGGSGVVATDLGKALSRRGHQVHFFSYDIPRKLEGATEEFHFHHVDVPLYPLFRFPPYTLALASTIYETSRVEPLDLVHVHYAIPHSTSAFLAKQMLCSRGEQKMKVITTLHGTDMELVGQMPSYKPMVEYSIDASNAVTAVSHYLKKATLQQFEIHRDIRVIYNPIDVNLFSPPTDSLSRIHRERNIVHISNFRPVKRINDVILAFDLIAAATPAKLLFIGEGPDRSAADLLVGRLGLKEKVSFLGPQVDVAETLKRADLLLSTSEMESFGLTLAEAMASEVPVVATCVGGVPEVVEDGVTGYLAPMGCVQGLAEAAIRILTCPDLQSRMGKAGRQRVLQKFQSDRITTQYEQLYEEVLNAKEEDCMHKALRELHLSEKTTETMDQS